MSARLFFVALFSVAFATPQVGDFHQRYDTDEEALKGMTEVVAEKVLAMSEKVDKAIREYKETSDDHLAPLLEKCSQIKVELRKTVQETVSKAMEKKKPLDTFVCITTTARASYQTVDAVGTQIQNEIHNIVKGLVATAENFKLSLKYLNEYVQDLFIDKTNELRKADNDAARRKILGYVKQKMAALEAILKNIEKRKVESEEIAKIKRCVP